MYWLEHDAKALLAQHGIPIPPGCLVSDPQHLRAACLPPAPWIVKGQIATGGRGKAGVVRRAASLPELQSELGAVLGAVAKGHPVRAARVEAAIHDAHETYLGLLLDAGADAIRVIVSAQGGTDIEEVAREHVRIGLAPPAPGEIAACVERLARGLPQHVARALCAAGERLARAFVELEALLVEINPLFVLADGRWLAGDAKLITDDNALPRQPALRALLERHATAYPDVARKLAHGCDYVVVDPGGEIGLLTTGAGLSMMLIDELRAAGLRPYNFLDIRTGGLRGETKRLAQVLEWIAAGPRVRVLLVNIFAGITDLGEFARLFLAALGASRLEVPIVARLVGNGLPEARAVLARAGIALHTDLGTALAALRQHLK
jgi:succinyl-CoA synthetase beta subunit